MSAARRNDNRGQSRKVTSSPYARPPQASGWRRFLNPITRLFGHSVEHEEPRTRGQQLQRSSSPEDASAYFGGTVMSIPDTASEVDIPEPPRSPSKTVSPKRRPPSEGPTPAATLEKVIDFLHEVPGTTLKQGEAKWLVQLIQKCIKGERRVSDWLSQNAGNTLDAIHIAGLISLLQEQAHFHKPEPFRFQSAPPSREASPATTSTPAATPRRTLKRNPNGPYRWEGAGSAKATRRNRYASPAFGTPQLTPEKSKAEGDKKRRKIDEEGASNESPLASKVSFPSSSSQTPRTNGPTAPKIAIPASPSKLKTPALLKPTTPSQPSPLRQAWSTSPSSSQEDLTKIDQVQPNALPKQSSAASLMSNIIQEITPPKKPDLSNPYQTASPLAKVAPPRRSARRARATGRPTSPENEKEKKEEDKVAGDIPKDLPAQAIIEATLPKGSKRSRPPANLEKAKSPEAPVLTVNGSSSSSSSATQEVDEDEEDRTHKKAKGVNGFASPFSSSSTSLAPPQEKQNEEPKLSQPTASLFCSSPAAPAPLMTNGLPSFNPPKSATAPSRPSKLRFSYQPETSSGPSSPETKSMDSEPSAPPPPTISSTFSDLPSAPSTSSSLLSRLSSVPETRKDEDSEMDEDTSAKPTPSVDPKTRVLNMPESSLPKFTFTISHKADGVALSKQREEVKSKPAHTLPTFDFSRTALGTSVIANVASSSLSDASTIPSSSTAALKGGFDWAAAGLKPPASTPSGSGSNWTCSQCMLTNPASATEKCTICEAPAPKAVSSPPTSTSTSPFSSNAAAAPVVPSKGGFDWAAAGLKPPTTSSASGSSWTCSQCMLSNPASATEKCTICEAPAPMAAAAGSSSTSTTTAAPKGGFDWAAAGLKPPTSAASGSNWTCGMCGLSNPASATTKCTICDEPRR